MPPRVLKAGISASLSGQFRLQGSQALAGLQAWAWDANRAGGLAVANSQDRWQVRVVHHDDASEPETARHVTWRLVMEDGVDLLFGPYSSALARAAAPVAEEHRRVFWNQGGAADAIYRQGYRWVVGILSPASQYLSGLAALVREADPDASSLAVLRATPGAFPRSVSRGAVETAQGLGFRAALCRDYPADTTDFSPWLDEVAASRPDVLLAVGRIDNDIALARQLASRPFDLGAAAVVAAPIQQFWEALGNQAEGFLGPSQWEPGAPYPRSYGPSTEEVVESLSGQSGLPVDYPMVQAYAAGLAAQRCVEEAGTLEQAALREVAGRLDFSTFYGRFRIDAESGRQSGRPVAVVQWQSGRKVVVWPPELRQGRLAYPWR